MQIERIKRSIKCISKTFKPYLILINSIIYSIKFAVLSLGVILSNLMIGVCWIDVADNVKNMNTNSSKGSLALKRAIYGYGLFLCVAIFVLQLQWVFYKT